jgi:hypothetical protein
MLSAYERIRIDDKRRTSTTIGDLRHIIEASAFGRFEIANNSRNVAAAYLVGDTLLDGARRRVEGSEDRFARALNDPRVSPGQLDEEESRAQWDICATLKLVRDHNDGLLPQDMDRIWSSWNCERHFAQP